MTMNPQLNSQQNEAVSLPLGFIRVVAGPGSGKTQVIIHRVNQMIKAYKCNPRDILVITFTKAAAEEMKSRYEHAFTKSAVTFGTFHSVFYRILKMSDPIRYDLNHLINEDDKRKFIDKLYMQEEIEDYEDFTETFLMQMTLMKSHLIDLKHFNPDGISKELFKKIYLGYENYKERHGLFDFDDMLLHCYSLLTYDKKILDFWRNRYKHILIDEFQDINAVQFECIKLLCSKDSDLFIVGDDDQSIYGFRGAKPDFLLQFKEYFSGVRDVVLTKNYRSTKNILQYSNNLILHNKKRYNKIMDSQQEALTKPEVITCEDTKEQAQHIVCDLIKAKQSGSDYEESAIIYRTNIQVRPIIEALLAAQIPFCLRDATITLYDQWITKDILAYLKASEDLLDVKHLTQIINRPSRYIRKDSVREASKHPKGVLFGLLGLEYLSEWQKDPVQQLIYHLQILKQKPFSEKIDYIRKVVGYDGYVKDYANYRKVPVEGMLSLLDEIALSAKTYEDFYSWEKALLDLSLETKENTKKYGQQHGVVLTTMHSAKGLEFDRVYIIDAVDGVIPHQKSQSDYEIEEERRLFYVGLTRAKRMLKIYIPKMRYQNKTQQSPFIEEMLQKPIRYEEQMKVCHRVYGQAIITKIQNEKAHIKLIGGQEKVINLQFCIKNKMLWVEE